MFLSTEEIRNLGLKYVGQNVQIDRTARIIGAENLEIGSNTRIDAQSVISCPREKVIIGSHVHLSVGVTLFGAAGIEIADFCGLACRVSVFSETDDYKEGYLTGPTLPREIRNVTAGKVIFEKHSIVGAGAVILPGVRLGEGASIGALTVISKNVEPFAIMYGSPPRKSGERDAVRLRSMEAQFLKRKAA